MRIFCSVALLLLATTAPTFAVNVRDYGAKCNGINDDTSAFKQAIAAAPFGGVVSVPPGSCVVTDTLVVNSTRLVSIVGDGVGSQIFQQADKTLLHFQNTTAVMIKNLFLGSAATTAGSALIKLTNSHRNRIENVMLGSYYGLHLNGSLLNTVVDLRSGINFSNLFFAVSYVSTNQYWVYAEPTNQISANANTQYFRTSKMRNVVTSLVNPLPGVDFRRTWHIESHIYASNLGASLYLDRAKYRIVFLRNGTNVPFVTGDQPIINLLNFSAKEVDLFYPLSPALAIIFAADKVKYPEKRRILSELEVEHYNFLIYQASDDQVYSNDPDYLASLMALPKDALA